MEKELKLTEAPRGHGHNFNDVSRNDCWIAQSSLASEEAIWLGVDKMPMQLSRQQVKELLPILLLFANSGKLDVRADYYIPAPFLFQGAIAALDAYLNAGSKEQREAASTLAKEVWEQYFGTPYHNTNEIPVSRIFEAKIAGNSVTSDLSKATIKYYTVKVKCGNCGTLSKSVDIPVGWAVSMMFDKNVCSNCGNWYKDHKYDAIPQP